MKQAEKESNNEIRIINNRVNRGQYQDPFTLGELIKVYQNRLKTIERIIQILMNQHQNLLKNI